MDSVLIEGLGEGGFVVGDIEAERNAPSVEREVCISGGEKAVGIPAVVNAVCCVKYLIKGYASREREWILLADRFKILRYHGRACPHDKQP